MRTVTLVASAFVALVAPSVLTPVAALPLHLGGTAVWADDDSMVQQVRVGVGRPGVGVGRVGVGRVGVGVGRVGVVRPGRAIAAGAIATGVAGAAYRDRYYDPNRGYCRLVYNQGQRTCRWYRQRWW
jgi:hypothetical protein